MAKLYGKGTIKEVIKGKKYHITFSCGKNPITGKYDRYTETFLGTKRQAELRVEEIRAELNNGKRLDADKITLAEWLESYLSQRESMGKHRPATFKIDRTTSRHIIDGLGHVRLADLTPVTIENFYASMRDSGVGDTTIFQVHRLLKTVLKRAVNSDVILRNPADRVDAPRKPKPNRQSLSIEDANRLSEICTAGAPTANKTAVYLALATGGRLGEILGLTWAHIALDGERPFAHLVQQFTRDGEIAPLKTDKDENPVGRIVPIDSSTVAVLLAWKAVQREQLNQLGIEQGNDTPVITNSLGTFSNHSRFHRWWQSFCVDNGFGKMVTDDGRAIKEMTIGDDASLYPDCLIVWRDSDGWPCDANGKRYSRSYQKPVIKTHYDGLHFHALRHTHFSLRLASGMDVPTAQALGGWSSPAMLMNVYAHPVAENIWNSAGFMDRLTAKQTA